MIKKISVIIPTLNEVGHLPAAITHLKNNSTSKLEQEVIVVDGGSTDGTAEFVKGLGLNIINVPDAPKGRAFLLNRGAKQATGEVLFFLDADCVVPYGYDSDIEKVLDSERNIGGAFEFKLDGPEFGLRVVEFINRTRYGIWPRYYGDQGLFVRQEVFEKVGGYPSVAIMESSDLCVSLWKEGSLALVKKPMLTSARRFLDGGIYRVLGFDIKAWWLNLTGRKFEHLGESYWQVNQNSSEVKR